MILIKKLCLLILLALLNYSQLLAQENSISNPPLIFPKPQEIKLSTGSFALDANTQILIPLNASKSDVDLAKFLVNDLVDKYYMPLQTQRTSEISTKSNSILMGTIDNPLIKEYCLSRNIDVTSKSPGKEGYVLIVDNKTIVVAGWDDAGAFYGLQTLRQLIDKNRQFSIPCLTIRDWPYFQFRGIRLFVPASGDVAYFKRFIKDFMALYKFNKLFVEFGGFRSDRHPEINAGWLQFVKDLNYSRTPELDGLFGYNRNSNHQDAGGGEIIDKELTRNLVQFTRQNYIDFIPEIPTLSHAYALINSHPELAAFPDDIWPDVYDPTNPEVYNLVFDIFDEYIDVIKPNMIHIGHDEWRGFPMRKSAAFKDHNYADLYISDVNTLYDYLTKKGIKVAMWGDFLLENVRGKEARTEETLTGEEYLIPGAVPFERVKNEIPKDILILNWMWENQVSGRENDETFTRAGFKQIFGNMKNAIPDYEERITKSDFIGGAPSSWAITNEYVYAREELDEFLGCGYSLWTGKQLDNETRHQMVRKMMPSIRRNLSGKTEPSADGDQVVSVDLASHFNSGAKDKRMNMDLTGISKENVSLNEKNFELSQNPDQSAIVVGVKGMGDSPFEKEVKGIVIGRDVSSLIFLHASINPGHISPAHCAPYNTYNTAEFLGWYEVVYEDGFKETIPIQYGVNIREYTSDENCYYSDAINVGDKTFYAFEWKNKRFGEVIETVNLIGTENARRHVRSSCYEGKAEFEPIPSNGLILLGVSAVEVRKEHIYPYR
ncbi:MAG: beta-N-acetylhexosaminidase [Bacteroidales bacterium]|nr:beta-N-acetylhexosaminidase [Bacteroidales bacterium]